MFELFYNGTSFGIASFLECTDYADYLVNGIHRASPDSIVIVDTATGEVVDA